jgi:hypothetical protein
MDEGQLLQVQALLRIERLLVRLLEQGERTTRLLKEEDTLLQQEVPKYTTGTGVTFKGA